MNNLFDQAAFHEIRQRLAVLPSDAQPLWGKMNVAQMLAHCCQAMEVPLSDAPQPRMLMGLLIGWMLKKKLYNDDPWKQGVPTAPEFIIKDSREFSKEKLRLEDLINRFYTHGAETAGKFPHPFFGKLTTEQWGKGMYKHLDHHLRQFGV